MWQLALACTRMTEYSSVRELIRYSNDSSASHPTDSSNNGDLRSVCARADRPVGTASVLFSSSAAFGVSAFPLACAPLLLSEYVIRLRGQCQILRRRPRLRRRKRRRRRPSRRSLKPTLAGRAEQWTDFAILCVSVGVFSFLPNAHIVFVMTTCPLPACLFPIESRIPAAFCGKRTV